LRVFGYQLIVSSLDEKADAWIVELTPKLIVYGRQVKI
jgi:hypothetical protein